MPTEKIRLAERAVILLTIFTPLVATALAITMLWSRGVSWLEVGLCAGFYFISLFGVTAGYHRLFTHRSFKCPAAVRWVLGIAGSMAAQGPVLYWVGSHRRHHQHSDAEGDPHSPHAHGGEGAGAVLRGWWHAHLGWMLAPEPQNYFRLVADLMRDPVAAAVNRTYLLWVLAGLALPGLIGGWWSGTWAGAATGVLWGGLVRVFLVHHVTWSINSICHLYGAAPYATGDESRNNAVCGVLALGEGWHNNHHAFPSSARHGLRWWQVDTVWLAISALRRLGLAWDVRLPSTEELARADKRLCAAEQRGGATGGDNGFDVPMSDRPKTVRRAEAEASAFAVYRSGSDRLTQATEFLSATKNKNRSIKKNMP